MFRCHFQSQPTPAPALHDGTMSWDSLQTMSFAEFRVLHSGLNIPASAGADPLFALWQALHHSPFRADVLADLQPLLCRAPSLDKFAALIKSKQGNSSGGPSGLQYKHIQHWKPAMVAEAYECLATIWQDRHIPAAWKWKWLVPIPKNASKRIQDIRPIMLMEVLRKLWTGLIVDEVTSSLQRHSALSLSQFLTMGQTPQIYNSSTPSNRPGRNANLSTAALGTGVRPSTLIVLCWQHLGLPVEIAQWLVDLDASGYTIVRTPYALSKWDIDGLDGIRDLSFNPERGTGQGDIHSPFTWLAVFDVRVTHSPRPPTCHGQSLHASASRCLPLPCQAYLLC